jgi:hypothetical protein
MQFYTNLKMFFGKYDTNLKMFGVASLYVAYLQCIIILNYTNLKMFFRKYDTNLKMFVKTDGQVGNNIAPEVSENLRRELS